MTGNLVAPNATIPITRRYVPKNLLPNASLCRVAVRSSSYAPCDWNSRQQPIGLSAADVGRFDPTPGDSFHYLYGAETSASEAVAIQETLRGVLHRDAKSGRWILPYRELERRSLVHFHLDDHAILADLRTQAGREAFGATEEVQYSPERDKTREWGAFFRANTDARVGGLAFNSTQETALLGSASFILWSDRLHGVGRQIDQSTDLSKGPGLDMVYRAFDGFEILILP